jgi:hypothetical protein
VGMTANCQTLAPLRPARGEVPATVGPRLFPPETWTGDEARLERVDARAEYRSVRSSWPAWKMASDPVARLPGVPQRPPPPGAAPPRAKLMQPQRAKTQTAQRQTGQLPFLG